MTSSLVGSEMCIRDRPFIGWCGKYVPGSGKRVAFEDLYFPPEFERGASCLLYTSDAADDM
eukprot:2259586-Prorocentrum_lima.AAC.1